MKVIKRPPLAIRMIRGIKALPWWGSALLAVAVALALRYPLTHHYWYLPPTYPPLIQWANYYLWLGLHYGQYVLPGALLAVALRAWFKGRAHTHLVNRVARSGLGSPLLTLSWQEFEALVSGYFYQRGFTATLTGGSTDGGIDITLRRGSETHFVQCKHWRANRVPVTVIRELYGVMSAEGAAGGFVVTSGEFTRDALAFAIGRNIELIDGQKLLRHIQQRQRQTIPI
ncbi:restriction endonuclease (plasmid) [Aeromonas media]|uniref:Restriction endonuclease n=1 Tax=Aeromonas caviae TaxID=648 RepID=A0A7D5UKW2_AERCA|nr:restriction endonuclease [Aeromonas caviae]QLI60525.1 restriction endonuclease [Aeromonas caviae]QYK83432.1 restriction endonuclease [Aeromonas media]